ncbi:hypothetical protein GCM10017673_52360 [Streptosporangium violaceochromogenes]|nr:hypothetical protein GCM10017673_52360 [Streptosporangium violaceochromogenes]
MVRRFVVLLAVAVTLLGGTAGGVLAQPSLNEQDKKFLVQAHRSNLAEIASARLAEERSGDQTIRDIAQRLVTDHTKLDAKVRQVAERAGVPLPRKPSEKQTEVFDRLSALKGKEFDRAWLAAQMAGHRRTLANIDEELQAGSSSEVKDLASSAKPIVSGHLEALRKAAAAGGGGGGGGGGDESPSPHGTPTG